MDQRSYEVAIVGAGLAGLAATRELVRHGVDAIVVEATGRVGGRAQTVEHGVELGPEFVHGRPAVTLGLLRDAGLELDPIPDRHHGWRGGALVVLDDVWGRFGEMLAGATERDESARAYLDRMRMSPDDANLFAMLVEGFYAAPLDDISIASLRNDASGAAGEGVPQARIRGGYQGLVDYLAARIDGVPVCANCVVHAIDWRGDRVHLSTSRGEIEAQRAIVTVPIGVLPEIRFTPALGEHAAALALLAMGQVVKITCCLRAPAWPPELEFVHGGGGSFASYWVRDNQLTGWAGGPSARALAGCGADELAERVLDGFARATGIPRADLHFEHHHFHDYDADPFARGAYSYTRVGGAHAAEMLARPLADKVFFAGEATDGEYEGTVAGALGSGLRAAEQILTSSARTGSLAHSSRSARDVRPDPRAATRRH